MTFPSLVLSLVVIAAVTAGGAMLTRRYFLFGLAGSALVLVLHGHFYFDFAADDAFISFRYARNLADGHGLVWNAGGERVEGYTGVLWLMPLAAAAKLGLEIPRTAHYLGFLFAMGGVALLYPLAAELPGGRRWPLVPVVGGLALAAATPFAVWAMAGMEMPLFILLVLAGAWRHLREEAGAPSAIPWSGIVFALAVATRPEGALFFAVSGAFKLAGLRDARTRKARFLQLVLWALLFAGPYGAYFAWRFWYYGYPLPNTFYAKVGVGADYYARGMNYLAVRGTNHLVPLLAAGLLLFAAMARPFKPAFYLVTLAASWLVWVVFSGGDSLVAARFLVPILPFLYLGAALGVARLMEAVDTPNRLAAGAAIATLFLGVLLGALYQSQGNSVPDDRAAHAESIAVGRWMARHLPPDTTIAVTRAGAVPYYSRLPALDMLGLNDTHIAHADIDLGKSFPGHEKYDIDYVLGQQPEIIFLGSGFHRRPLFAWDGYLRTRWNFQNQIELVRDRRAREQYEPVAVELRPGRWLNLLVVMEPPPALRAALCSVIQDSPEDWACPGSARAGPTPDIILSLARTPKTREGEVASIHHTR